MSKISSFNFRFVMLAALLGVFATAMYGFAAQNTVAGANSAGDSGDQTISGYEISGIRHIVAAADPTLLDSVEFDLSNPDGSTKPSEVQVQFNGAGTWYDCTSADVAGPAFDNYTCDAGATTVEDADSMRIVAADGQTA